MLGLVSGLGNRQHTTTSSATAISTTSTAAAGTTLGSLINSDSTAGEPSEVSMYTCSNVFMGVLDIVHGSDSGIGIGLLAITDESEATATTGISILYDDLSRLLG
jgi:hypothetical protein